MMTAQVICLGTSNEKFDKTCWNKADSNNNGRIKIGSKETTTFMKCVMAKS